MNYQPTQPPYARITVLALFLAAIAQLLLVPPAWKVWPFTSPTLEPISLNSPIPAPTPHVKPLTEQESICGMWLSETSRKQYNFVCQGQNLFEIYEVGDQGLNKNGSGKIFEGGDVEADILSLTKNRKAHLKLRLSNDGRKMEGSWRGDDPRESGQLTFHRT
jgi:hypothetical protein